MDQNPAQTPTPLSPSGQKTLADTLLELGFIDAQKANDIKVSAITQNTSQEQTILTGSFATREQLIQAKSALLNVPAINLSQVGATPEALSMLHESVAKRYKIFLLP